MSLSDTFELSGHIVVKTGRGIGYHESVDEEVVFIGVAFSDASAAQPASDASAGLVESSDPSKPWCYDKSRREALSAGKGHSRRRHTSTTLWRSWKNKKLSLMRR